MPHTRSMVLDQLGVAWALLDYHLEGLGDDECLWAPADRGLHVRFRDGEWVADWPETEAYALGPPSIAWVTWHIGFWWSMALDHSFGPGTLRREDVRWPGSADAARAWIRRLHGEWVAKVSGMDEEELASAERSRWPFSGTPFHQVALWLNLELMKNAAEIGYGRFLYAVREQPGG